MTNMKDVNNEKSLQDCQEPSPLQNSKNIDPVPDLCADDGWPSQKRVAENPALDWILRPAKPKVGPVHIGQSGICDPIQTGQIINDLDSPNRDTIYRYSRALRGANEAMVDLFKNTMVIDEEGKAHVVPIIWGSQEKAVAAILQDNVRKDTSLVVDRIRLPIMAINVTGHALDLSRFTYQAAKSLLPWWDCQGQAGFQQQEKFKRDTFFGVTRGLPVDISYTLYLWTMYQEDMDQILEQVLLKFSPVAYIRIRGVYWEVIVQIDNIANNLDVEPGDKLRVLKYQFDLTAKSYIPQPITRIKDISNVKSFDYDDLGLGLTDTEIQELMSEFEG